MEYVTLNNGVKMPMLGYGTYQTPPRITEKCVTDAIQLGYRSMYSASKRNFVSWNVKLGQSMKAGHRLFAEKMERFL